MIRVLVKTSSAIARIGLESLLKGHSDLHVMAESTGNEPGPETLPDVLVVEAEGVGDDSAHEAMDWARTGGNVVLLLRNTPAEVVAEALQAGVKAVLPSGLGEAEIVAAVEAAAAGLVVVDGLGVEALLRAPNHASADVPEELAESLTPREIEVLRLLAAGLGNKEIASRLGISEHTVKFHVASVMGKLGAASRTEAVTLGIRRGFILI